VYYRSCLHHIRPYATETESVRYLPRCSLELLKIAGNTVAWSESTSAIHVTLCMFNSLAFIVQLYLVAKVIPDCSLAPNTFQAVDPYFSQLQGPHYFRYLPKVFWGLAKAMIRIYSQRSSWSSSRIHNRRRGAASGLAVCKDSSWSEVPSVGSHSISHRISRDSGFRSHPSLSNQ
jgi:hypothetical protein